VSGGNDTPALVVGWFSHSFSDFTTGLFHITNPSEAS